jgi:Big-like domain-containing protein
MRLGRIVRSWTTRFNGGQHMRRRLATALSVLLLLFAVAVPTAHAVLQRMGPINNAPTVGGFPAWFQDTTGLTMEFCDLMNTAELNGGWCTLIPPGPVFPEVFPTNFFIEHFYHDATSVIKDATTRARLTIAVEASFANGSVVVQGDQMTFGRIRVFITGLPASGTYKVYHPYGVWTFPGMVAGDRLFFTEDVGLGCVGTFTCTLGTSIGPFLLPSATPGGAEVPPIPDLVAGQDPYYDALAVKTAYPGTGKKYIADPARLGPVTGGTCVVGGPIPECVTDPATGKPAYNTSSGLRDPNIFRVEGPNGYFLESSTSFSTTGRLMTGSLAGQVIVNRASYAGSGPDKLDVFASAFPTTQARVPAQTPVPPVTPILGVYEAPCGGALTIDPVTGAVTVNPPPYSAPPVGTVEHAMASAGSNYWGQGTAYNTPIAVDQRYVCVEDYTARDAAGNVVPAFYLKKVTDDVAITLPGGQPAAYYNGPAGGTLTVTAASSDTLVPTPTLTLTGFGGVVDFCIPGTPGCGTVPTAVVTGLAAPPAKVQVVSAAGGVAELPVTTAVGAAAVAGVPTAVNDDLTMFEDCQPLAVGQLGQPATGCTTPLQITPLTNDTYGTGAIPAGATITITQAPRIGTASLSLAGVPCAAGSTACIADTILYTPFLNINGTEGIGYTVTVNGVASNQAYITILITPVNDFPTAIGDTTGALRGVLNSVNVLANDIDPDGATDLASAKIVTGNTNLGITAGTVFAGGVVTFTPLATLAAGPQTFTYQAVDKAGAVSASSATVTVNVSTTEAIVVAKSIYTQAKGRWTVSGTDSPPDAQTLTIKYDLSTAPTYKVNGVCTALTTSPVIGTAVVDALGNWLFDQILNSTAGLLNPSNSGGNSTGFWCAPPKNLLISSSLSPATAKPAISLK